MISIANRSIYCFSSGRNLSSVMLINFAAATQHCEDNLNAN